MPSESPQQPHPVAGSVSRGRRKDTRTSNMRKRGADRPTEEVLPIIRAPESPPQSSSTLFENSLGVSVDRSNFQTFSGLNINVNVETGRSKSEVVEPEHSSGSGTVESVNREHNIASHSSANDNIMGKLPPLPIQRSCDIYYRHLAVKGRGSPLWLPAPNWNLPIEYRRTGISIGDVGLMTASGSFDFLFNILLPPDHPVHAGRVPEMFFPLSPPLDPDDVENQEEFAEDSYLASASVEKAQQDGQRDSSGLAFETTDSEGAILTIPRGSDSSNLLNVARFNEYLAANIENWYCYTNGRRGREAKNGDLRLIVGWDKAQAWGMATFSRSSKAATSIRLDFKPSENPGRSYKWECSGTGEGRTGPSAREIAPLRRASDPGDVIFTNQCLFIRTLNHLLPDDVWARLKAANFGTIKTEDSAEYDSISKAERGKEKATSSAPSPLHLGPVAMNQLVDSNSTTSLLFHPSTSINEHLLSKNPDARIAITEDVNWMSVLTEDDNSLPFNNQIVERVMKNHDIRVNGGVVYLTPKMHRDSNSSSSQDGHLLEGWMHSTLHDSGALYLTPEIDRDSLLSVESNLTLVQVSTIQGSLGSDLGNDGSQQLETVIAIVNEVGKLLGHLPYIQPLGRIIIQFVKIRNEIKTNRERCQEVIDKVLRKSEMLYKRLLAMGQSPNRDRLSHLENVLINYQSTLNKVYKTLQVNSSSRSRNFLRTITDRTVDDINQCDRLVDSIHNDVLLDIVMEIRTEQVGSPNRPEPYPPSILTSMTSTVFTHTLPPKPKLMVERDGVLNNLVDMLLGEQSSRIAILGGQGFGKTTCSLFALHDSRIARQFANRFYLSCESITNAQSLLVGIAHMLGISSSKTWSNLIPSIRHFLQGGKTLICLDNFESTWEELSTRQKVEEALASISAIENLSLVVNVKGKERPASVDWTSPPLPPLDRISLSCAESIVRGIAGIQAVDQYTHNLLEAVEGIPLAITLISNLLRDGAETSSSLWRRWSYKERRQNSMMGGTQNEENSQTSKIDAAIAISINSPQMKKYLDASNILATLSLLPDGFSSDDKHLLELQTFLRTNDIHKCLDTLQNLGLLRIDEAVIPHRIRVLSPVKLYCHKFLASEISAVSEELTNYYVSKMIEIGMPTSSLNAEHTTEMDLEIRNIHSLFRRKYISKKIRDADLQKFVKTSYFLGLWSIQTGYMLDDILELAIASSSQLPIPRARCRLAQSNIYREMGRFEDAERLSSLALNDFQTFDDLKGQEEALAAMASIFHAKGSGDLSTSSSLQSKELNILYLKRRDMEKETQSGLKALETFKVQSGVAPHHIAYIYIKLGTPSVYMDEARLTSALSYLHRAQEIYSQTGHAMGEATVLFYIGYGYLLQNQLSSARRMVENGRTLCPAVSSQINKGELPSNDSEGMIFTDQSLEPEMQAVFLTLLAHICIREDHLTEAKALLKKAIKKKNKISVAPKIKLGLLYIQQNRLDKAEIVLSSVLKQCRQEKYTDEESEVLAYQGVIHLRRGNLDQAEETLKLSRSRGLVLYAEVDVIKALADVSIQKGDLKVAEELLKHAMYVQKHINSAFGQGNVFRSMGDLYFQQEKFSDALVAYQEARQLHKVAQWVSEEVQDIAQIGTVHKRQGNFALAEDTYEEARRLQTLIP